jgi:GNAT superfamily N-acetyltransferase
MHGDDRGQPALLRPADTLPGLHLTQFDGRSDPAALQACFDIVLAGHPYDEPNGPPETPASFAGQWVHGWDGTPHESWLGRDGDGEPVCCCLVTLPNRENTTLAYGSLHVLPGRRRSGFGSALLRHCAERARSAGRSRLSAHARDGSAGAAFAAAVGARGGIDEVIRMMDVDASLPGRLAPLRASALSRAAGYELLSWAGITPEEQLDQAARLHGVMADAPRDEGREPSKWDADRVATMDQVVAGQGLMMYTVVARLAGSDELAAMTQMATDPGLPDWAFQQVTAVVPAHRGHSLGLLVKMAMLDLLTEREPAVRRILTGNAGLNAHMIAINEQLGYYVSDVYRSWQLDLATGDL